MNSAASLSKSTNYSVAGTFVWSITVATSYFLLLLVLAGPHFFGHRLKAGDLAEQVIISPRKIMVIDEEKTGALRDEARHEVLPVLRRDPNKAAQLFSRVEAKVSKVQKLLQAAILPLPAPPSLTSAEQIMLLQMQDSDFEKFKSSINTAAAPPLAEPRIVALSKKVKEGLEAKGKTAAREKNSGEADARALLQDYFAKLSSARQKYKEIIAPESPDSERQLLQFAANLSREEFTAFAGDFLSVMRKFLHNVSLQPYTDKREWELQIFEFLPDRYDPVLRKNAAVFAAAELDSNVSVNEILTEKKVEEAIAAVKPVMKPIETGSVIVHRGETLQAEQIKTLESLGITQVSDPGLATVIAIALFAAYLLFGVYLYTYEPKLFYSPSAVALMSTVSIITCVTAFFIGQDFPQFVPLSATTLILAVTYGRRLTGILTVLLLLFLSVSELLSGSHLVALGTAAGMALGASVKRRRDLMLTGILVGCMQSLGYVMAVLAGTDSPANVSLSTDLPMEMLGGLFSSIAAIGILPFLENIFGILTPYRIAELAEPDQPLMRQLEENAPGTYQHSLAVANLAEGGARSIGADVNLVHTGAMYHDIGKMVTPRYFIENQLGDKNPHDFIPPEESRAKVLAHVTNGIALAQKYGLPKAIQAFIPEHQGTTVMAYFYHKACMRDGSENVDPNLYRYPGPKPQTKESAIVMLADVSEAVTHSMHDPTMEEVEAAISNVFKARWDDQQFSESTLTIDELEKVKRGFVRVWRTLHHDRLKYPATTTGKMPVVPVASGGDSGVSSPAPTAAELGAASPSPPAGESDCCG
ncbi:MAG: HDIG domain-containing protein [Candidatus Obscuribacterales bacterium]|nr:HDIG domain-containing protein [Candidatus Obscuribacterales bacterium]